MTARALQIAVLTSRNVGGYDHHDVPFVEALEQRGHHVSPQLWDDPAVDWAAFDACVVRSPWDYYLRPDAFRAFLDRIEPLTPVFNPVPLLRWNIDKRYLLELKKKDVPVVTTVLCPKGEPAALAKLAKARHWTEVVVKPAVSAGAYLTLRAAETEFPKAQEVLDRILQQGDALVQPYLPEVAGDGEKSLVFIDGRFSHALRKRSAFDAGEVRTEAVRAEVRKVEPAEDELALAARVLAAAWPEPLLYARVDMLRDEKGSPRLMELEVTEPSLFLKDAPAAAVAMADALVRRLGH